MPQQRIGEGVVGPDMGPSTVAVVGEDDALLEPFSEGVVRQHHAIRRHQRKIDRAGAPRWQGGGWARPHLCPLIG